MRFNGASPFVAVRAVKTDHPRRARMITWMGMIVPILFSATAPVPRGQAIRAGQCPSQVRSPGQFDRAVWDANHLHDLTPKNPRAAMARQLVNQRLQPGMTKAEVVALLGRPNHTDPAYDQEPERYRYSLGLTDGWVPVPHTLVVTFLPDGRMSYASIEEF